METIEQMADAVLCRVCERLRYRNEYTISPSIPELVETELNILFEKMTDSEASSIAGGITDYATIKMGKLKPKDFQGDLPDYIRDKKDKHKGKISTIDDLEFVIWGYIWLCAAAVLNNNTPTPQPKHFTRQFTPEQRKKLYDGLRSAGYLPEETPRNHFDFVFGTNDYPKDFKPLYWQKTKTLLAYLIYKLFSNHPKIWKTAETCFEDAKDLKQTRRRYLDVNKEEVPKNASEIDRILHNAGIR